MIGFGTTHLTPNLFFGTWKRVLFFFFPRPLNNSWKLKPVDGPTEADTKFWTNGYIYLSISDGFPIFCSDSHFFLAHFIVRLGFSFFIQKIKNRSELEKKTIFSCQLLYLSMLLLLFDGHFNTQLLSKGYPIYFFFIGEKKKKKKKKSSSPPPLPPLLPPPPPLLPPLYTRIAFYGNGLFFLSFFFFSSYFHFLLMHFYDLLFIYTLYPSHQHYLSLFLKKTLLFFFPFVFFIKNLVNLAYGPFISHFPKNQFFSPS